MGFRLVLKSATLNYLERRNGHYCAYLAEFGSFRGQLRKSGCLAISKCSPKNVIKYTNTPTKYDGRAVLFAVAELLVVRPIRFMLTAAGYSGER